MRRNVAFEKLWQEIVEAQIPKVAPSNASLKDPAQVLGDMRRYAEDKVDSMRQQKDEELEQYKKEIERAKRFEGGQKGGEKMTTVKRKVVAGTSVGGDAPVVIQKRAVIKKS